MVIVGATAYTGRGKAIEVQVVSPAYQDLEDTVATGGTVVPLEEFPGPCQLRGHCHRHSCPARTEGSHGTTFTDA